jgi:hypothetical protein
MRSKVVYTKTISAWAHGQGVGGHRSGQTDWQVLCRSKISKIFRSLMRPSRAKRHLPATGGRNRASVAGASLDHSGQLGGATGQWWNTGKIRRDGLDLIVAEPLRNRCHQRRAPGLRSMRTFPEPELTR